MFPVLYPPNATDFSTFGLGVLTDTISCEVTEERNGVFECLLKYPVSGQHYRLITKECIVRAKPNDTAADQAFRVYRITKPLNGIVTIYGQHISYDLANVPVLPFSTESRSPQLILSQLLAGDTRFTGWTDYSDAKAFSVTQPKSVRACLGGTEGSMLSKWHGEFEWDNFTVKYYGAAILQKQITVSYLTKEKRPNTGELPMYYIEKDHEPIVSPETFQMVQEEMRRRREAGSNMQCVSIFSSRIICGDCGGYYGRKIWHSNTKHASWHWHCNAKFQKRKYCETPTLKEESLEETFVEVFNGLIANRKEIEENYRLCIDTITDDSEYRRQLEDLNNGCGEVQTLIRSLLMTYSRQDTADDIHEKLKEYEDRLDTMARLKQELDLKIAACAAKRVQITGFLNELMKHDAPLAKFDPLVWQAVINYATVNRDCTITFTFRDGTEKTVPIKNGVRPYTKRNKLQEVDGNDG